MLRASLWDVVHEHGGWTVHVQSVPMDTLDPQASAALARAVGDARCARREITVHDACVLLSPQGDAALVEAVAHVDPHLPYVPQWLVEFVLMAMLPVVYSKLQSELRRVFSDPNSQHSRRNRGVVYESVRATL